MSYYKKMRNNRFKYNINIENNSSNYIKETNNNQYNINHNNMLRRELSYDNLIKNTSSNNNEISYISDYNKNNNNDDQINNVIFDKYNNNIQNKNCNADKYCININNNKKGKIIHLKNYYNNSKYLNKSPEPIIYKMKINKINIFPKKEIINNNNYQIKNNNVGYLNNENIILRNKSEDIKIEKLKKRNKKNKIIINNMNNNNNNNLNNLNNNYNINYYNNINNNNLNNINNIYNNNYTNNYNNINNNLINTNNNFNYTNINNNFNNNLNYNNYNYNILNNMNFNYNNFNNMNNYNDNFIFLWYILISFNDKEYKISINPEKTFKDLLNEIYLKFYNTNIEFCRIYYNANDIRNIDKSKKISEILPNPARILIVEPGNVKGGGLPLLEKQINIKFIKLQTKISDNKNYIFNLFGLLKLCLLKEVSLKLNNNQIAQLPVILSSIMEILKNGKIESIENKESIKEILNKIRGSNIITFSRYIDKIIGFNYLQNIFNFLNRNDFYEINDIKNRLTKYNEYIKFFEKEFENAKRNSIFEFSIISLVIIERPNFDCFERERRNCPNRVEKILFHGTNIDSISSILTDCFKRAKVHFYGEGIYFTDSLDYCWYYGGQDNRININKIPKISQTFSLIANFIYYNNEGLKNVNSDSNYTPEKNEINMAKADVYTGDFASNNNNNIQEQLLFNEYVINNLDQICPFIGAKFKRDEFCVIWRDTNFSPYPVNDNQYYDNLFKQFLKERVEYIEKLAKFNIYMCDNSEEALELVKRKKYNKIILISNVGPDYGGKQFIIEARKILENDVITLFLAYNIQHLQWIKNFKNAFFSNEPQFYERYLNCFEERDEISIKDSLKNLRELIEAHYNVQFNFDDNFLDFPLFKTEGNYSDLNFK